MLLNKIAATWRDLQAPAFDFVPLKTTSGNKASTMRPQSNTRRSSGAWSASAAAALLLLAACSADDKEGRRRAAGPSPPPAALANVASASAGAGIFTQCAVCHPIQRGAPDRDAPNLFGVMGNAIAQNSPRYGYTAALRQVGGTWTQARMDAWLTSPKAFVPGTSMGFAGLSDPLDRADVMAYLETQR